MWKWYISLAPPLENKSILFYLSLSTYSKYEYVGFEVLPEVAKITVIWDVTTCSLMEVY
jgi:hypothetical protein